MKSTRKVYVQKRLAKILSQINHSGKAESPPPSSSNIDRGLEGISPHPLTKAGFEAIDPRFLDHLTDTTAASDLGSIYAGKKEIKE